MEGRIRDFDCFSEMFESGKGVMEFGDLFKRWLASILYASGFR